MKSRSTSKSQPRRIPAHELFPQPGVYRPHSLPPRPRVRRQTNLLWGGLFLGLFILIIGLLAWMRKPQIQAPYVLVEVRAIEEKGHPVAAARLSINEKPMGITDSFGEWRRYLRLQPGQQLSIDLMKSGEPGYRGSKVLRVPRLRSDEPNPVVRSTIELKTDLPQPRRLAEKKRTGPPVQTESLARQTMSSVEVPPQVQEGDSDPTLSSDTNDASMGLFFDDGLSAISVQAAGLRGAPTNLLEKHQAEVLQEKILPLLLNDLQGLGLKVDRQAPWKLQLSYVPKEDQVGYIRAQISWQNPFGQAEKTAFIAGFAKTFEETVRALSSLLRLHMKKSFWAFKENGKWFIDEPAETRAFWRLRPGTLLLDTNGQKFPIQLVAEKDSYKRWQLQLGSLQPCHTVRQRLRCLVSTQSLKEAPPLLGWQRRRVTLHGQLPKQVEVFVAGFQALPVGEGRWEYWGHPGSKHKALVMAQGKIIHSEVFVDQPQVQTVLRIGANREARHARR